MTLPPDMQVKQFWPTTLYRRAWAGHAADAASITEFLYGLRAGATVSIASGVAPAAKSAHGLFESDFDLFARDHAGLGRLVAFLDESVRIASADANGDRLAPAGLRVTFPDSWFHITNDGGYHDAHVHGGCSWCGIYYVQAGDSAANTPAAPNGLNRFYSPLTAGGGYKDYGNNYLKVTCVDPPARDGTVILFPSYLLHSALPYRGAQDRIVISFNAQVMPKDGKEG